MVNDNVNRTNTTTDYLSGFQYKKMGSEPVELQFFPHAEGYVHYTKPIAAQGGANSELGSFNYVFNYTDHLGNVRLSYARDPLVRNRVKILEENHYYAFGLKHKNYNVEHLDFDNFPETGVELVPMPAVANASYNYKYNGKQLQEELGLNMYDYGARNYDSAIGRWMNVDPLAEQSRRWTPYNYAYNNPLVFVDPDGMQAMGTDPKRKYNNENKNLSSKGISRYMSISSGWFSKDTRNLEVTSNFSGTRVEGSQFSKHESTGILLALRSFADKMSSNPTNMDTPDLGEISSSVSVSTITTTGTFRDAKGNTVEDASKATSLQVDINKTVESTEISEEGRVSDFTTVNRTNTSTIYNLNKNEDGVINLEHSKTTLNSSQTSKIGTSSASSNLKDYAYEKQKTNIEIRKTLFDNLGTIFNNPTAK